MSKTSPKTEQEVAADLRSASQQVQKLRAARPKNIKRRQASSAQLFRNGRLETTSDPVTRMNSMADQLDPPAEPTS